ncbi:acyl-homoserine-lactone synthase [Burkholderia thailandensis]|nr:acyl-homoserine-lactone synthase [Burkholderia thailandensis]AHI66447.1 autoinducer synthetase family protein [Burkholderia thailandensis H0587]AHI75660.1 autoinducer synthetase family protein [Burkholderia thailandensis 2002721723]AHI80759.1 autoinducer synthetase family protein [Burkholderia thailandensis E444]AIC89731.1 autoinducer synthetase family protein [Burkholderia thailandensis USAMRU Malaysia \
MSYIIAGRLNELPPHVQTDLGAYRYDVFVRRLGWTIAGRAHDGHAEWDEFDGPSTIHVVALDDAREVCGYARLLPTTGPYLLRDVFPHLLGSSPAPQSPAVWEMSRFAASRRRRRATEREPLGMDFFPSVLTVAASLGATRVVGVMTLSIERLYRRSGIALHRLGSAMPSAGGSLSACSVELPCLAFAPLGRKQCASCLSMH